MATPATTTTGTVAHGGSGAAQGGAFPPFQSETFASQLLWLAITFGFLYWLADRVIVPRLGAILADRASRIGGDLNEAAAMKTKAEEAVAAYEKSLAEARAKSQAIAQETRDAVNAKSDERRKAVESDLSGKLAEAEGKIVAMKSKAMGNVSTIAADAAATIVAKLTGVAPSQAAVDEAVKASTKG
ncbi:F0F1 ATP synthase subunit B [Bosea sp. (in: a-proteobacteria)]|jgi:F-type H+-transporting ATPase subunit b|uniref:F0F1 ATP synthase subunit B n=1 Tax=Bosea sp. (in: a-proteobacteria) TaxID=1871050 RepID=UPI003F6FC5F8